MLKISHKKGQTAGMVTGLVFGVAALIIGVIIALIITSTLGDANLLDGGRTTVTVSLESPAWINSTTYTLDTVNVERTGYKIVNIYNISSGDTILAGNYTLSSGGVIENASTVEWSTVMLNYTYVQKGAAELTEQGLANNFTQGIGNVSLKIPTVFLVAAIVLILGVLAVLVAVWQRMRLGGGSTI